MRTFELTGVQAFQESHDDSCMFAPNSFQTSQRLGGCGWLGYIDRSGWRRWKSNRFGHGVARWSC